MCIDFCMQNSCTAKQARVTTGVIVVGAPRMQERGSKSVLLKTLPETYNQATEPYSALLLPSLNLSSSRQLSLNVVEHELI